MASHAIRNFMKQQGFPEEANSSCDMHFAGLNFQPRTIAALVVLGTVFRWPLVFLLLSAALWWSAFAPTLNPFELFYNRVLASRRGVPSLRTAPAPRRFAQGMAATMALVIAVALLLGWTITAAIFEGLFIAAIAALLFGRLCVGAYVYHLLRGEHSFANATLPWVRSR
jgi:hypothetical protein